LQINAIVIFPKVMGIMSKPRFLPMNEKAGTFNSSKAPEKPNKTRTEAEINAFINVTCKVDLKERLPNKLLKPEKLISNKYGNKTRRVTDSSPMVSIRQKFIDSCMLTEIMVFFLSQFLL
jgi:hypothetical protein